MKRNFLLPISLSSVLSMQRIKSGALDLRSSVQNRMSAAAGLWARSEGCKSADGRLLLRIFLSALLLAYVSAAGLMPRPVQAEEDPFDDLAIARAMGTGTRGLAVLELGYDHGDFRQGDKIPLIKVEGGRSAGPEPSIADGSGCPAPHRHSNDDLFICEQDPESDAVVRRGPFEDTFKRNCGHGRERTAQAKLELELAFFPPLFFAPAHYFASIKNVGEVAFDNLELDADFEFPNLARSLPKSSLGPLPPGESIIFRFLAFAIGDKVAVVDLLAFGGGSVVIDEEGMVQIADLNLAELEPVTPPSRVRLTASGLIIGCSQTVNVDASADLTGQFINADLGDNPFLKQGYTGSLDFPPQSTQIAPARVSGTGSAAAAMVALDGSRITSYRGDGTGGFRPDRVLQTIGGPTHIHIARIDNDGFDDVVSIDVLKASYSVFFGSENGFQSRANGGFQQSIVSQAEAEFLATTVGDVNGDGTDDLIAVDKSGVVTVMVLNRDGSLAGTTTTDLGTGPISGAAVTSGNLDGDPFSDIVVATFSNNAPDGGRVATFSGDADGNIIFRQSIGLGGKPSAVGAGDLNGDGTNEVIVADSDAHTITVLKNDGAGGLSVGNTFLSGGLNPIALAVTDINRDGKSDLVAANRGSSNVSIFLGDGKSHLFLARIIQTAPGLAIAVPFDFNNDGKVDIAVGYSGADSGPTPQAIKANDDSAGFTIYLNDAEPVARPIIEQVQIKGKHLIVTCSDFGPGAKVLLDGVQIKKTILQPDGRLRAKKAAKQISPGQRILVQVESEGKFSEWFIFRRPD